MNTPEYLSFIYNYVYTNSREILEKKYQDMHIIYI